MPTDYGDVRQAGLELPWEHPIAVVVVAVAVAAAADQGTGRSLYAAAYWSWTLGSAFAAVAGS